MSSAARNLTPGHNIGNSNEKRFCSFNGFMIQVFVVQSKLNTHSCSSPFSIAPGIRLHPRFAFLTNNHLADYWVFAIATCTYLILANHKHQSSWIQDHRSIIWVLPWVLSVLWAIIGLAVVGYGDIGAWCWFTSDRTRLFVNFIPRWIIIITILCLYLRLYFIIHTAHSRFMSFDEDAAGSLQMSGDGSHVRSAPRVSINMNSKGSKNNDASSNSSRNGLKSSEVDVEVAVVPTHNRIPKPSPHLKRISYQMMTYPLVYMLIWTIPTTIRIYQATTGHRAPFGIATVDKACIVIQGLADALVYGLNERTWVIWRDFLMGRGRASNA